jgi:hypothetical protein
VTAGTACPILAWNPSTVSATLRLFGPENLGGLGDLQVKAAAEAAATGKPIAEIASSVSNVVPHVFATALMTSWP